MSELLTAEEYRAIAAGLEYPAQAFIDGAFRPAASGDRRDRRCYASGVRAVSRNIG